MNKKVLFLLSIFLVLLASPLFAQQAGVKGDVALLGLAIGAGIAIGVAAAGGGIGQGLAVSSALEGIARNPSASDKIFTPMIIGLALIESLVIYGLVIAFTLQGKI